MNEQFNRFYSVSLWVDTNNQTTGKCLPLPTRKSEGVVQVSSNENSLLFAKNRQNLSSPKKFVFSLFSHAEYETISSPSRVLALKYKDRNRKLILVLSTDNDATLLLEEIRSQIYINGIVYTVGIKGNFPETLLGILPKTSICLSGGGIRAHVAGSGQLRALLHLGLLSKDKISYLSSTSGGTWAATIFSFYEKGAKNDEELLGSHTSVEDLSLDELSKEPSPITRIARNSLFAEIKRQILAVSPRELFHNAIGKQYLEPFGLNGDAYFTMEELVEVIKERNPLLASSKFYTLKKTRPFWICNASMLGPSWHQHISDLLSLQFTALYCGAPYMHTVHYKRRSLWSVGQELDYDLGGAMIDPFAYESNSEIEENGKINPTAAMNYLYDYLEQRLQHGDSFLGIDRETFYSSNILQRFVSLPKPNKPLTLREVNSIVGFAFGLMFRERFLLNRLVPSGNFWNPNVHERETVMQYADGGMTDNLAILPMLQRKVKRNIVFFNGYIRLPTSGVEINFETFPSTNLLPLFGFEVDESVFGRFSHNQVFEKANLRELVEKWQKCKEEKAPLVARTKFDVLHNDFWNIEGGWEVEILWFYLENSDGFMDRLPAETQDEINMGDKGMFKNFPTYDTFGQDHLTNEQINLLQAFTEWQVLESADLILDFLKEKEISRVSKNV